MTAAEFEAIENLRQSFAEFSVAAARDVVPRSEYRSDQDRLWKGISGARALSWKMAALIGVGNVAGFTVVSIVIALVR